MVKVKYKDTCVLCGQPVEIEGFTIAAPQGLLKFCCAGCLSIYQLLNEDNSKPSINKTTQKNEDPQK